MVAAAMLYILSFTLVASQTASTIRCFDVTQTTQRSGSQPPMPQSPMSGGGQFQFVSQNGAPGDQGGNDGSQQGFRSDRLHLGTGFSGGSTPPNFGLPSGSAMFGQGSETPQGSLSSGQQPNFNGQSQFTFSSQASAGGPSSGPNGPSQAGRPGTLASARQTVNNGPSQAFQNQFAGPLPAQTSTSGGRCTCQCEAARVEVPRVQVKFVPVVVGPNQNEPSSGRPDPQRMPPKEQETERLLQQQPTDRQAALPLPSANGFRQPFEETSFPREQFTDRRPSNGQRGLPFDGLSSKQFVIETQEELFDEKASDSVKTNYGVNFAWGSFLGYHEVEDYGHVTEGEDHEDEGGWKRKDDDYKDKKKDGGCDMKKEQLIAIEKVVKIPRVRIIEHGHKKKRKMKRFRHYDGK
ncbi:hypothetical protein HDE_01944 [Halotydeus destructor]|nr:hypothetical protein HDE_01944 [Halotydeus destructor]